MNPTRKNNVRGVLTLDQYRSKTDAERKRLIAEGWLLVPAGADGDDDDDNSGGSKKGGKKKSEDGDDEDDDDGEDGDEKIEISQKEYDGLQSTIGSLRRDQKKLQKQIDDAADDDAKNEGKFEELYEKEKAKVAERDATILGLEKGGMAEGVAARLNFHNPKRAVKELDLENIENEADAERALKQLAKSDPYMVNAKKRQKSSVGDDDGGGAGDNNDNDDSNDGGDKKADTRTPTQKVADAYGSDGTGGGGGNSQE